MKSIRAAVIQLEGSSDESRNFAQIEAHVRAAVADGATFVATPENANYLGPHDEKVRRAEPLDGPTVARFAELARRHAIWFLLGSFNESAGDSRRCRNTSVLFAPDGRVVASYRKRHIFDVDVSDKVRFVESDTVEAGDEIVVTDTPFGRVGFSICYDLRFPEHYRALLDRRATVLTAPAAFTASTGRDHWDILTRARAIETQSWLLAPAQVGPHDDGGLRESWGHSRIVDPWGAVVAEVEGRAAGWAAADLDLAAVDRVRASMPVAAHRRDRNGA